jgi:hypothetical protein
VGKLQSNSHKHVSHLPINKPEHPLVLHNHLHGKNMKLSYPWKESYINIYEITNFWIGPSPAHCDYPSLHFLIQHFVKRKKKTIVQMREKVMSERLRWG